MASTIKFECKALAGTNKVGTIKQNANGYYPMVVGALNMYNSAGQYYDYERAKSVFEKSSQLMRRADRGSLRGEYGHPKMEPGMSNSTFANRVMAIYEERACCHHKSLTLDFDNYKDDNGNPVVAIISEVFPSGPFGPALEKSINNPGENVCFSIRAFTDDKIEYNRTVRIIRTVVTFDYVNEPGMSVAQKWKSPALEGISDHVFSKNDLQNVLLGAKSNEGVAQESIILSADELFVSMGWDRRALQAPAWTNWK